MQAAPHSRLPAARLCTDDFKKLRYAFLYVKVSVVDLAFGTSTRYLNWVTDEFGVIAGPTTGSSDSTGSTGAHDIVEGLSIRLDAFLAAYLRVSEEPCESTPQ